ncbi:hypothetical protein KGF54_003367 [Candida jiufengensis]|uniref:uncharacterized protein n=1 Tax=Candida jiufengensis TaxID=497108 RepID=UPI0022255D23|nr:uncharacterized protein KGF54_003367 [Candida jiufengensis]KAI5952500.1 hypothetical protein KGF54_003367 [Candida jiufengensis]
MSQLPEDTIETITQTLKLYNSVKINEIIIFTKNLQYIGTYPETKSKKDEDVKKLKELIESIGTSEKKLVSFKVNSDADENTEESGEYITHFMEKFIMVYKLEK